jgi:hypothetical protein
MTRNRNVRIFNPTVNKTDAETLVVLYQFEFTVRARWFSHRALVTARQLRRPGRAVAKVNDRNLGA